MSETPPHHHDEQLEWVYGIGEQRADRLNQAGIQTCYQLATADERAVTTALGVSEARAGEFITAAQTTIGYYPNGEGE